MLWVDGVWVDLARGGTSQSLYILRMMKTSTGIHPPSKRVDEQCSYIW